MKKGLTQDVKSVVLSYIEAFSTPRAITCFMLVKYEEWDQLTQLEIDPLAYDCPFQYRSDAAVTSILRKYDGLPIALDLETATKDKWLSCERDCYLTNERLSPFLYNSYESGMDGIWKFIQDCRKMIECIIGLRPPSSIRGRFGPGATLSDKSSRTTVLDKLSSTPTQTVKCQNYESIWKSTCWGTLHEQVSFVNGNVFFTVPKHSRALRPCAKEPSINSFIQLGVGRVLRDLLKKNAGIDLNEGQHFHRQVAEEASKTGCVATIDLSSASDTVAYNLVKLFLPPLWFELLDSCRSPKTYVDGKWHVLEKFSSMGNGFTFELETLIFFTIASIASGLNPGRVMCYGDDIIVPTEAFEDVTAALSYFGFTVNSQKTFGSRHWFRESCGGDFFNGVNVRPYFLKADPDEPQKIIVLANGIRRMREGWPPHYHNTVRALTRAWHRAVDLLPTAVRQCRGPKDLGDTVIHDDEDRWCTRWRDGIRYVKSYRPATFRITRLERFCSDTQMAAVLYLAGSPVSPYVYGSYDSNIGAPLGLVPRDGVIGYKVGYSAYS